MATHSSVLAERIPWTEEPGGQVGVHGVAQSQTWLSNFHSQRCVVLFHCSNLYFPDGIECEVSFHMLVWQLYVVFDVAPCKVFGPFLIRLVFLFLAFRGLSNFRWQSIIRCIFCKYFLPVCGLSSHSVHMFFTDQESLILMKMRLSISSVNDHACGVLSKRSLPYPRSSRFSPLCYLPGVLQFCGGFLTSLSK